MVDETQTTTDASFLHVDAKYWLSGHPQLVYAPAALLSQEASKVRLRADEDDFEADFDAAELQMVHKSALQGVDDLMDLGDQDEASLLNTVRTRYARADKLYTQIGSAILIAMNPFRERR